MGSSCGPKGRSVSINRNVAPVSGQKSLESWIWQAACSIRGAKDAPKFKEFILPLIFAKRLCDVFDDEVDRIGVEVGSRSKAFKLVKQDKKLVRFYLPIEPIDPEDPVWSVIRTLSDKIGEQLTTHLRSIADANPLLKGIIDRVDFNATTHGQRDLDDSRLSNLVEAISEKRLGLKDVEPDIIGRSYEYLIRKFAEGSGQSAGEFYTPAEVGLLMARIMDPEPGMEIYDPCCGSAGLLIKCQLIVDEHHAPSAAEGAAPIKLYGQENEAGTWAMANMNMIIHDLEGEIQIGDTFRNPKFRAKNRLRAFDRVVANPMWNQTEFKEQDYDADELQRFPNGAGYPGNKADWGWMQHVLASLKSNGRAAVVLDTGAAARGSGNTGANKERDVRRWFVEQDLIEGVIHLPEDLFYNTASPGIIIFLNRDKPQDRKDKVFLVNAGAEFVKGDPKNFMPPDAIVKVSETFRNWTEVDDFSMIMKKDEIVANDYNISPTRYIQSVGSSVSRPISEILDELLAIDVENVRIIDALNSIISELRA